MKLCCIYILSILCILILPNTTIAETIEIHVEPGQEFFIEIPTEGEYKYTYDSDWIIEESNRSFRGVSPKEGIYWLNFTTGNESYHYQIIVTNGKYGHYDNSSDSSPPSKYALLMIPVLVLITGLIMTQTDYGKWLIFGYNYAEKDKLLDHETRYRIHQYLQEHPGAYYTEIKKALNIPYRTLRHHLKMLERHGCIRRHREGLLVKFWIEDYE